MHKLSESVTRKFVDSLSCTDLEIETESGWVDITHINKTIEYERWVLETDSGIRLECADTHIVFDDEHNEVFVCDLTVDDKIIGQHGIETVAAVYPTRIYENMYDLSVSGEHTYYANGLLHHNTATTAAFLCWYVLFNDQKTVAVLANKATVAREILQRIETAYEYLPKWMQSGVVSWNKGSLELENGSRVLASATSSSAVRGFSISCLYLDEFAHVENNLAEEFFTSVFPTLSSGKETKLLISSTPNGYNAFWKLWNEGEKGINGFKVQKFNWWDHPDRDQKWADEQRAVLGELKYTQEVECLGGDSKVLVRHGNDDLEINLASLFDRYPYSETDNAYEIMTPSGWQSFDGVRRTKKQCARIITSQGNIIASLDHKFSIDDTLVECRKLKPLDKLSDKCVVSSISLYKEQYLYDPVNVGSDHVFLHDNGIISHNCHFLGSSRTLLTGATLSNLSHDIPIKTYTDQYKGLNIYVNPVKDHLYTMTVDVSRGRHLDSHAFMIFDVTEYPHRIVASYNNNETSPLMYAGIVHTIACNYNKAYILVEINDIGAQVAEELYFVYEYENLYWTKSGDQLGNVGADPYPGIRTTKKTKRIGCANLKDIIEKNQLIVNDFIAIHELSTFIQSRSGSYEADEGFHDDAVACLWLFAWLLVQPWFKDLFDRDIRNKMYLDSIKQMEEDLMPIFFDNGLEEDDEVINW